MKSGPGDESIKNMVSMGKPRQETVFFFFWDMMNFELHWPGPGGTPRPIELHSHDPLRYVGDMLAWLHQASASEKEYLQSLLKSCTGEGLFSVGEREEGGGGGGGADGLPGLMFATALLLLFNYCFGWQPPCIIWKRNFSRPTDKTGLIGFVHKLCADHTVYDSIETKSPTCWKECSVLIHIAIDYKRK